MSNFAYYKEKFYEILQQVKSDYPNLRITTFNRVKLASLATGEQLGSTITIAIGKKEWHRLIAVLLHELAHYTREVTCSTKYKKFIETAYDKHDTNGLTKKQRWKFLRAIAREEYMTDVTSWKYLKKYGVPELIKENIASSLNYNLTIKFSLETRSYSYPKSGGIELGIKSRVLTKKEAAASLTKYELTTLHKAYKEGYIIHSKEKWVDKDE